MADDSTLQSVVTLLSQFRLTDAKLAAQLARIRTALDAGMMPDLRDTEHLLDASKRYFKAFSSEANSALRDVDRRLINAHQVVANYTSERSVLAKRIADIARTLEAIEHNQEELAR